VLFISVYLLALIIGTVTSFPIGPLGLLCIQRSIKRGFFYGFVSGIGAALSDFTYGLIVLFSYNFIDHFVHKDNIYINLILGIVFFILGIKLLMSKDLNLQDEFLHPMLSAYFIGISNMGTCIIFLAIFTYFPKNLGLDNFYFSLIILLLILAGAILFWFFVCESVSQFNKKFKLHHFILMDKVVGIAILSFSALNLFKFLIFLISRSAL
jgi:threonine/homoserine/homoserine lactone efflux protein